MSNALYPKAKESFLSQNPSIDLDSDTIKLAVMDAAYTFDPADQFWSDVSADVAGTPQTLGSKVVTDGKFTSAAATFTNLTVTNGKAALFKDTGTPSTSPLIAYYDAGTNIPITIAGGDTTISPHSGNGWFTL